MARAYLNGIRIEMDQHATIADYEGLVGQAAAEMIQFRETWGDDDFIAISRTGDAYTLQRINGQDVIIMGPVPHAPGEPGRRDDEQEDPDRYPAVCFDMQSTTSLMAGFYVCATLDWDPVRFLPIDPDRPHRTSNYRLINADGSPNQSPSDSGLITEGSPGLFSSEEEDSIEPLELISTQDVGWDYTSTYSSNTDVGQFIPGSDGHNPPSWTYQSDLYGNPCAGSLGNPAEEYEKRDAPWLNRTGYYGGSGYAPLAGGYGFVIHNSYCKDPASIYCSGCLPVGEYSYGESHSQTHTKTNSGTSQLTFLGELIHSGSYAESTIYQSVIGGYGGSSSTSRQHSISWSEGFDHASAVVRDVDGYADDQTWMIFWTEYDVPLQTDSATASPWYHDPYNGRGLPGIEYTQSQTYWLRIHTPEWEIEMQYAEPSLFYTLSGAGSYDDVYPWTYEIYDFNGEPVFVFSVYDEREECFVYGSAYQGEIYFSEPFPYDGQYMHDVGDPDDTDGARGRGLCSAVAHVRNRKELNEYAEE